MINRSSLLGTSPKGVIPKNRPNWDAYDSWAGMMPFNRDRIYQGSIEAAAFRRIMNIWTWQKNAPFREVIEQLELQPEGVAESDEIRRLKGGAKDGHIWFAFDGKKDTVVDIEPKLQGKNKIKTNYSFNNSIGTGEKSKVIQGDSYVTVRHSEYPRVDTEGRGVILFDHWSGSKGGLAMNPLRIADELIKHKVATGDFPIDVRPIALAIVSDLLEIDSEGKVVKSKEGYPPLSIDQDFFRNRIMRIDSLLKDTEKRSKSLPRRKADFQRLNLDRRKDNILVIHGDTIDGLIQEYGKGTYYGDSTTITRIRQEVFQRITVKGSFDKKPDQTVMGGIFVDREIYNDNTQYIALFRYFLEPLGVSVDQWSMNVRSRSLGYNFADVFLFNYDQTLREELTKSLKKEPVLNNEGKPFNVEEPSELIKAVNKTLSKLPNSEDPPKYVDIQRIFNKACIECHGGLNYPPVRGGLNLSEDNTVTSGDPFSRLRRSYDNFTLRIRAGDPDNSPLYKRLIHTNDNIPQGLMPLYGPPLSQADIQTIRRWIKGYSKSSCAYGNEITMINSDPHDFLEIGQFTLLKGIDFELQVKRVAVADESSASNFKSINSAVAIRLEDDRISYQPSLVGHEEAKMELRVNGELMSFKKSKIELKSGGSILILNDHSLQIEGPGKTKLVINSGWWSDAKLWYVNIEIPKTFVVQGILGEVVQDNWLPAYSNGKPSGVKPQTEEDQQALRKRFLDSWTVTEENSLFDDEQYLTLASKKKTSTLLKARVNPQMIDTVLFRGTSLSMDEKTAKEKCSQIKDVHRRKNCIQDVLATGELSFANTYLAVDEVSQNKYPKRVELIYPQNFDTISAQTTEFKWKRTMDDDGDRLTYYHYIWNETEDINDNNAQLVFRDTTFSNYKHWFFILISLLLSMILWKTFSRFNLDKPIWRFILFAFLVVTVYSSWMMKTGETLTKNISDLKSGKGYYWKVIAEDGNGGTVSSDVYRIDIQ